MLSANFKFNNPNEPLAFIRLLSSMPRRQHWDDIKGYSIDNTCHICNDKTSVKSGVVPFDDFFERQRSDGYSFWNCCESCHNHGLQFPYWVSRKEGMRYWRIGPTDKTEERIITDFQIFKFPSVALISLDTISITV